MPAYFSVEFSFEREVLNPNFVCTIYNRFFNNGFTFKAGFWNAKNYSLEEIISWNQAKLDCGFRLGFTQNVSENYRQILLINSDYEHLRLYWIYWDNEIHLTLSIPESEVMSREGSNIFIRERVTPIIEIAKILWDSGMTSMVQSSPELDDGSISLEDVRKGIGIPTFNPFAIVSKIVKDKILSNATSDLEVSQIANNGYLIVQRDRFL